MKVGSLVKHKQTGKIGFVTWVFNTNGTHFRVWGYPLNQLFTSVSWEILSESR
jgi:hypothetical protein